MTISTDRRQRSRYAIQVPIHVEAVGTGVTHDISPGGVAFHIDGPLDVGTVIRFELTLSQHAVRIYCEGRVVRVEMTAAGARSAATIDTFEQVAVPVLQRGKARRSRAAQMRVGQHRERE